MKHILILPENEKKNALCIYSTSINTLTKGDVFHNHYTGI